MGLEPNNTRRHNDTVTEWYRGPQVHGDKMPHPYALLSIVYMISFMFLFERVHYKNTLGQWLRGGSLMNREELDQIRAIWAACQEN